MSSGSSANFDFFNLNNLYCVFLSRKIPPLSSGCCIKCPVASLLNILTIHLYFFFFIEPKENAVQNQGSRENPYSYDCPLTPPSSNFNYTCIIYCHFISTPTILFFPHIKRIKAHRLLLVCLLRVFYFLN